MWNFGFSLMMALRFQLPFVYIRFVSTNQTSRFYFQSLAAIVVVVCRDLLSVYAVDVLINTCVINAEKHQISQQRSEDASHYVSKYVPFIYSQSILSAVYYKPSSVSEQLLLLFCAELTWPWRASSTSLSALTGIGARRVFRPKTDRISSTFRFHVIISVVCFLLLLVSYMSCFIVYCSCYSRNNTTYVTSSSSSSAFIAHKLTRSRTSSASSNSTTTFLWWRNNWRHSMRATLSSISKITCISTSGIVSFLTATTVLLRFTCSYTFHFLPSALRRPL